MADDPFLKIRQELEQMDLPDPEEGLEERLRRKIEESKTDMMSDEEVEQRRLAFEQEVDRAAKTRIPEPEDFEHRLSALERKTQQIVGQRQVQKKEVERRQKADQQSTQGLGVGLTAAYAILGMPLIGALIGYLIDKSVGSTLFVGILTLIGAIAGIAFALLTIREKGDKL